MDKLMNSKNINKIKGLQKSNIGYQNLHNKKTK